MKKIAFLLLYLFIILCSCGGDEILVLEGESDQIYQVTYSVYSLEGNVEMISFLTISDRDYKTTYVQIDSPQWSYTFDAQVGDPVFLSAENQFEPLPSDTTIEILVNGNTYKMKECTDPNKTCWKISVSGTLN